MFRTADTNGIGAFTRRGSSSTFQDRAMLD